MRTKSWTSVQVDCTVKKKNTIYCRSHNNISLSCTSLCSSLIGWWCFLFRYLSGPVRLNIFGVANNQLSHVLSCNESLLTYRVMTMCFPTKLIFIIVPSALSQLVDMLTVCQIKHSVVLWVTSQEGLHVGFEGCINFSESVQDQANEVLSSFDWHFEKLLPRLMSYCISVWPLHKDPEIDT